MILFTHMSTALSSNVLMESLGGFTHTSSHTPPITPSSKCPICSDFILISEWLCRVLLATIRDNGLCPCPRCLVKSDEIPNLGLKSDMKLRKTKAREDNLERRQDILKARNLIFQDGLSVKSKKVESLLRDKSYVLTEVGIQILLSRVA